ncbi:Arm DNA-binding domain-containing protein [Vogesella indigofera]|uniref:Arm DNA-binding domain-containing protein n=1 Tax=Vogesella indigofera TaxID=45465 RepID=UPI00234D72D7|nr:DUF3596 domain-containing protein [Vogesella indigofera]MDC7704006.1 DUF3596 domain-containing protein [Vogesella indigofera]
MGRPTATRRVVLPEGVEIREWKHSRSIRITFTYQGKRRRETLDVEVTPANIKYAARLRGEVLNEIARGTFDYSTTFPSSKHAKREAKPKRPHQYRIEDLVNAYIDSARRLGSLSPSSVACYARWARSRIIPQWGDTRVDEITTPELRDWIVGLSSELAPKSVRNCVGLLSSVLNRAAADGIIPASPLTPIKMRTVLPKKKRVDDDKIEPFNSQEIKAILDACTYPAVRAVFQFAFGTGMRTGEVIAIKWQHIDLVAGRITVADNVVSAEGGTVEKSTKTDSTRVIPMLPAARIALEAMWPVTGSQPGNYVFINPNTGKRWGGDRVLLSHWTKVLQETKVRYRNPYQTRHTFASMLLMAGEPELTVAKLLGHTTVEMVRRHYGRYISQPDGVILRGEYNELAG